MNEIVQAEHIGKGQRTLERPIVKVGKAWKSHARKSPAVSDAIQKPSRTGIICNLNQSNFGKMMGQDKDATSYMT